MPLRRSLLHFSILCISCVLCSLFTTGCWNRQELNTLGITVGLGVDKVEDGYNLSVQVVNPNQIASKAKTEHADVVLYQQKSPTIMEGMRKLTTVSPRKIYLAHLRVLIIGEEQARDGLVEVLDYLSREHEARADFYVIIAKGMKASELLNVFTQIDTIPSIRIFNMMRESERLWAPTVGIRLDKILREQGNHAGKSSVLSGIEIKGDKELAKTKANIATIKPPGRLHYSGVAVLKHDKLVGWLNEKDGEAYNYIVNNVHFATLQVPCESSGKAVLEVVKARTKLKGSFQNGKPMITVNVNVVSDIGESLCPKTIMNSAVIKKLEQSASEKLESELRHAIEHVQHKYQTDIFGFGEVFYRSHPREWRKLEPEWESEFKELQVDVKVKCKINRLGTVNDTIIE